MPEAGRAARVATLYESGFPVGPSPDRDCQKCAHNWGAHLLHVDFEDGDVKSMSGRWSCPQCDCVGTWDVAWPGKSKQCVYGRMIKPPEATAECMQESTSIVYLDDTGDALDLCDVHYAHIVKRLGDP